jgi:hypothetical protein
MPGYKLHGKPMLYFAGFKEHYSLFAASGTFFAALEDELRGYDLRKGTVHFPLTKPVPVKLIRRIANCVRLASPPRRENQCWAERKERASRHSRRQAGQPPRRRWLQDSVLPEGRFWPVSVLATTREHFAAA